jgi:glyoxylase-like metal-dependent hydrolase (beta-lactamase superfamily II)
MSLGQNSPVSRRRICFCCLTAAGFTATGGSLTPGQAFAEARGLVTLIKDAAASSPVTPYNLRGNVSVLEGSGGNIAVLTGPDGTVLVDSGISVSRPQLSKALITLSSEPVTHLINTHWHFDHTSGNEWLHSVGAKIIAHENTRKHLSEIQRVEDWDYNFLPSPAGAIPSEVLSANRTLKLNRESIDLRLYKPAHTDTDLSVTFADVDILHVGDTFWNGIYPFIDYSTGGSIDGMIAASDANLAAATDSTVIIPGHGKPVSNRSELKEFRDMLADVRDKVAALKRSGRTPQETVAAKPTAVYDAKWGQFVIDPPFFTKLVYQGV